MTRFSVAGKTYKNSISTVVAFATHVGVAPCVLLLGGEDADEVRGASLEAGLCDSGKELGLEGDVNLGSRDEDALGGGGLGDSSHVARKALGDAGETVQLDGCCRRGCRQCWGNANWKDAMGWVVGGWTGVILEETRVHRAHRDPSRRPGDVLVLRKRRKEETVSGDVEQCPCNKIAVYVMYRQDPDLRPHGGCPCLSVSQETDDRAGTPTAPTGGPIL